MTRHIPAKELEAFAAAILQAAGYTAAESTRTAQSLILSDLVGYSSHGVIRVTEYVSSLQRKEWQSGLDLAIRAESASHCVADGQRCLGQVQMPRLLERLFEKAKTQPVVSGTLAQSGHVGRLGEWVENIAAQGLAGFLAVNDNGAVLCTAPYGGKEATTSTNPFAFGIPLKNGGTFTLDTSTSATAQGKMRLAYLDRTPAPKGLIQDSNGTPTTNPAVLFEEPLGSILPMGGHKGFGLSMMVDCLTAGLSGGYTPPAPSGTPFFNTVSVTIWNPAHFCGLEHMQTESEKSLAFVRNSAPIDSAHPVRIPGERAKAEKEKRLKNGIPLEEGTIRALIDTAEELSVQRPEIL